MHLLDDRRPPVPLMPRLIARPLAASYLGIGTSKFDELVRAGRLPRPKKIDARRLWDVRELDAVVDDLPTDGGEPAQNPWDHQP